VSKPHKPSPGQAAQRNHRHRLGSITFCMRLLEWHLKHDQQIPRRAKAQLEQAVSRLYDAGHFEACNTVFSIPNRMK